MLRKFIFRYKKSVELWNIYQLNDYINLSSQLHGSQISLTTHITVNPSRPPLLGGKELAPVPMRQRGNGAPPMKQNNRYAIEKVLSADLFEIHYLEFEADTVKATVTNTKFRSAAQAVELALQALFSVLHQMI